MSTQPGRPGRRPRPRPAADEKLDPVDYRAQPQTLPVPTPTPVPPLAPQGSAPGRKEATVQLATRISLEIDTILIDAVNATGKSKRALVEEAIKNTWT